MVESLRPPVTLGILVLLFGRYALVDLCFSLLAAIGGRPSSEDHWLALARRYRGHLGGFRDPVSVQGRSPDPDGSFGGVRGVIT